MILAACIFNKNRKSSLQKGSSDNKDSDVSRENSCPTSNCGPTPNLLELKVIKSPPINGQPAWSNNPNIAGKNSFKILVPN